MKQSAIPQNCFGLLELPKPRSTYTASSYNCQSCISWTKKNEPPAPATDFPQVRILESFRRIAAFFQSFCQDPRSKKTFRTNHHLRTVDAIVNLRAETNFLRPTCARRTLSARNARQASEIKVNLRDNRKNKTMCIVPYLLHVAKHL